MIPFSAGVSPPPQTALLCRQPSAKPRARSSARSEEHTSELQSQSNLVCRLLLEKKNNVHRQIQHIRETTPAPASPPRDSAMSSHLGRTEASLAMSGISFQGTQLDVSSPVRHVM